MKEAHFKNLNDLDSQYWWNRVRFEFVRRKIRDHGSNDSKILLDIGCGTGSFLSWLREDPRLSDYTLIGADASQQACEYAKTRNVKVLRYDFSVPLSEIIAERPSLITMLDVLEHIPNPVDVLQMIKATAAKNAVIVILVPAFEFLWSPWDDELGHCRRYTKASLKADVSKAGWTPLTSQYLFGAMFLPALVRKSLINRRLLSPVEFPNTTPLLNALLTRFCFLESRLGPVLPCGTSVACVALNA